MPKFSMGWRRQAFDPRDRFLLIPAARAALPPLIDLSPGMGPQLDQGNLGSCGPNTADELLTYDQKAQGLPVTYAARQFVYWWTRYLMGTVSQDSGVDNRTMLKALATYGFCPESMDPYSDTLAAMTATPTAAMNAAAKPNVITDYAAVVQALAQMQGVLATGKPFMFGFDCYQQIMSDQAAATGVVTDPPAGASPIGGHDVSFCGYNAGPDAPGVMAGNKWPSGTFKFRNHWYNTPATPWGDGGYGYISFAYGVNPAWASDFWTINTVPGGGAPPVPVPPSPPVPPPSPAPGVSFDFLLRRAIRKGGTLSISGVPAMPAGTYGVSSLTAPSSLPLAAFGGGGDDTLTGGGGSDVVLLDGGRGATPAPAFDWSTVITIITGMVAQYGPAAAGMIDTLIDGLSWPAWEKTLLKTVVDRLLGKT